MRVLQLISSGGYYGAEAVILNLSKALRRRGCEVRVGTFLNLHATNTEIAKQAEESGFPVQLIPCAGRLDWNAVRALRSYVRDERIEVIHSHGYKADIYGYFASRHESARIISTCHLWPGGDVKLWLYSMLDRLLLRRFPRVVAVSEEIAQSLRRMRVSSARLTVIDNGIDMTPFTSAMPTLRAELGTGSAPIVGLVGRLAPQKGPDYLLRAARLVRRRMPDVRYVFVGDGPEKTNLQAMAERLSIADKVFFLGRRDDMPQIYRSLDLMVLPSREEGMPMTIIEALAAGTPVIATRVGSVPKLIRHQETGLLLESGDIKGLSDAIVLMLSKPELRREYAATGRQLVYRQYSADCMADKYLDLYSQIVVRPPMNEPHPVEAVGVTFSDDSSCVP